MAQTGWKQAGSKQGRYTGSRIALGHCTGLAGNGTRHCIRLDWTKVRWSVDGTDRLEARKVDWLKDLDSTRARH